MPVLMTAAAAAVRVLLLQLSAPRQAFALFLVFLYFSNGILLLQCLILFVESCKLSVLITMANDNSLTTPQVQRVLGSSSRL